jgi:hypothetical protein
MPFLSYMSPNQENDYTTGTFNNFPSSNAQTISHCQGKTEIDQPGGEYEIQIRFVYHISVGHTDL